MNDDMASSDVEFDAPSSKLNPNSGKASIAQIVQHAQADRFSSKKTVKQLQFGRGAPTTMASQSLWVNRFNSFRQQTLRQQLTNPFTGEDFLRFLDSIIGRFVSSNGILNENKLP